MVTIFKLETLSEKKIYNFENCFKLFTHILPNKNNLFVIDQY